MPRLIQLYLSLARFALLHVMCYLLIALCYLLSEAFHLKLAITCKNLFLSLVVVRLVIFWFNVGIFSIQ